MPLFRREGPEERTVREQRETRDRASAESLARGGLPLRAQERLAQERAPDGRPRIWTSDLSVDELLAAHAMSFEPVSQVFGSSIYHMVYNVGRFWMGQTGGQMGELSSISQAFYQARELAMGRMLEEAQALGAHGVIGMRLEHRAYAWGVNLLEFTAIGTAVRLVGWKGQLPAPFTSDLSGQDFLKLLHAGYVPVTLAMGTAVYYVMPSWILARQLQTWMSQEVTPLTQAVYGARRLALARMAQDAQRVHAEGVVGSDLTINVREVEVSENLKYFIIEIFGFGTAIAEIGRGHEAARPTLALDLNRQVPGG
jgi:uncharacterized protein YbjQ (UPF0145 family)